MSSSAQRAGVAQLVEQHLAAAPLSEQIREFSVRASTELVGHVPEDTLRNVYADLQQWATALACLESAMRLLRSLEAS